MNYNKFEANIKKKLSNHEVKVDEDALIKALFNPQDKKRRFFPLWGYFAGCILIITSFVFIWTMTGDVSPLEFSNDVQSIVKQQDVRGQISPNEKDVSSNSGDAIVDHSNLNNNLAQSSKLDNSKEVKSNTTFLASDKNHLISNITFNSSTENNTLKKSYPLVKKKKENVSDNQYDFANSVDMVLIKDNNSVDFVKLPVMNSFISLEKNKDISFLPDVKCPTFRQRKVYSFSIGPEIGVFYPLASMDGDDTQNEVLRIRKKNEVSLEGIQAALYGKLYQVNGPLYFKSGLNYSRITRRMIYEDHYTKIDTTIGIISITESENHDTITVIKGPIYTETNVHKYEKRHYYHHMLSLPVLVGFQTNFNSLIVGLEAGVSINLFADQTGYIMISPDKFGLINDAALYRRRLGVSYIAGMNIGVPLYNNILSLSIRANINPNNFASSSVPFKERYQMLGAHLMYEIRF